MASRVSPLRAALFPEEIPVEVAGVTLVIPAVPASVWLRALVSPHVEAAVLPGMLSDRDATVLTDMLESGRATLVDLNHAAYRAIGQASGTDWWVALRLAGAADHRDGNVLGELTLHGVDPASMPLGRWCAAAYSLMVRNMGESDLIKFQAKLFLVPSLPGLEIEEATMDDSQVMAMLASLPGVSIGG